MLSNVAIPEQDETLDDESLLSSIGAVMLNDVLVSARFLFCSFFLGALFKFMIFFENRERKKKEAKNW
jgi:hypothetical protein